MATWGYGKCSGPETWAKSFPAAGGQHQSPINIVTKDLEYDVDLEKHKLIVDIKPANQQTLLFHGHNFKVEAPSESITVKGGPLEKVGTFKFAQLHFHWGKSEHEQGSEHKINGEAFASELHLVHYNVDKYPTCGEACSHPDGLTVLGVLIKVGEKNPEIEKLIHPLSSIRSAHKINLNEHHSELNLKGILPKNCDRYFTYSGSLTTPPCSESVTWIVFEQPITMSADQLLHFRAIHTDDECGTPENFRPVCPLNNRKVRKSFK